MCPTCVFGEPCWPVLKCIWLPEIFHFVVYLLCFYFSRETKKIEMISLPLDSLWENQTRQSFLVNEINFGTQNEHFDPLWEIQMRQSFIIKEIHVWSQHVLLDSHSGQSFNISGFRRSFTSFTLFYFFLTFPGK